MDNRNVLFIGFLPVFNCVGELLLLREAVQQPVAAGGDEVGLAAAARLVGRIPRAGEFIVGEAAAVDFFGPRYGLPKAISGHMAYYVWGPRDSSGKVLITIGSREDGLKRAYYKVEKVAEVGTRYSMPDEHGPIFLCTDPKLPMNQIWSLTKVYR